MYSYKSLFTVFISSELQL